MAPGGFSLPARNEKTGTQAVAAARASNVCAAHSLTDAVGAQGGVVGPAVDMDAHVPRADDARSASTTA